MRYSSGLTMPVLNLAILPMPAKCARRRAALSGRAVSRSQYCVFRCDDTLPAWQLETGGFAPQ